MERYTPRNCNQTEQEHLPIAHPVTKAANERVLTGTATQADRANVARGAYRSHWGTELEDAQDGVFDTNPFGKIVDGQTYGKRYATLYEGFIKRVFTLQGKIDASEDGHTSISTTDFDGNEVTQTVGQEFVDTLATMADRMRNTLYDYGMQRTVNRIHHKLGIRQSPDNPGAYIMDVRQESQNNGGVIFDAQQNKQT